MAIERKPESFRNLHLFGAVLSLNDLHLLVGMVQRAQIDEPKYAIGKGQLEIEVDEFTCDTWEDVEQLHAHTGRNVASTFVLQTSARSLTVRCAPGYFNVDTTLANPEQVQIAKDVSAFLEARAVDDMADKTPKIDLRPTPTPTSAVVPTEALGSAYQVREAPPAPNPPAPLRWWQKVYQRVGPVWSFIVGLATVGAFVLGLLVYVQSR